MLRNTSFHPLASGEARGVGIVPTGSEEYPVRPHGNYTPTSLICVGGMAKWAGAACCCAGRCGTLPHHMPPMVRQECRTYQKTQIKKGPAKSLRRVIPANDVCGKFLLARDKNPFYLCKQIKRASRFRNALGETLKDGAYCVTPPITFGATVIAGSVPMSLGSVKLVASGSA